MVPDDAPFGIVEWDCHCVDGLISFVALRATICNEAVRLRQKESWARCSNSPMPYQDSHVSPLPWWRPGNICVMRFSVVGSTVALANSLGFLLRKFIFQIIGSAERYLRCMEVSWSGDIIR